jgi:hypothetical protein
MELKPDAATHEIVAAERFRDGYDAPVPGRIGRCLATGFDLHWL